jgi:hypothetical protein
MKVSLNEELNDSAASWKKQEYEVWYRDPDTVLTNLLSNPDFDGQFDYQPYVETDEEGNRWFGDFMSGNHAWRQSVRETRLSSTSFNTDYPQGMKFQRR